MASLAIYCLLFVLFLFSLYLGASFCAMWRDHDFHIWPGITRCRLCEKRVFIWQMHEMREYNIKQNPHSFMIQISGWGIVHKKCPGTPEVECVVRPVYAAKPSELLS